MLFRKKLQRSCSYCKLGTELSEGSVLCAKKGIMNPAKPCRKFRYEPTKRIPGKIKTPDFAQYNEDDFNL